MNKNIRSLLNHASMLNTGYYDIDAHYEYTYSFGVYCGIFTAIHRPKISPSHLSIDSKEYLSTPNVINFINHYITTFNLDTNSYRICYNHSNLSMYIELPTYNVINVGIFTRFHRDYSL